MSNTKKTIEINPNLFHIQSSGVTRKNRDKRNKIPSLIQPNALKKQLLNRIKEHKSKEWLEKETENDFHDPSSSSSSSSSNSSQTINDFTDEFMDSMDYLDSLSKQREMTKQQQNKSVHFQQEKHDLHNRTLKHHRSIPQSSSSSSSQIQDNISPLKPYNVRMASDLIQSATPSFSTTPFHKNMSVPYGCLKGGNKPTYREYHNNPQNNPIRSSPITIHPSSSSSSSSPYHSSSLSQTQSQQYHHPSHHQPQTQTTQYHQPQPQNQITLYHQPQIPFQQQTSYPSQFNSSLSMSQNSIGGGGGGGGVGIKNNNEERKSIPLKQKNTVKRTIKKKYNLGKSSSTRKVGILIKDKTKRKQVIDAQRELKKESMSDVKKYLRSHGLIKAGSHAPTHVIRQMYESSMLSGDIMNLNKETLLHNCINEDGN